ncbi:MAG TPA: RNA methyltransferase [Noviherbaspirillum sp.]|jgi:TrmH family RNA methyltransferase|uniref:TrmH family RNA methyltransferase n=1 Tax=Noviherbaspirillum sp. TaxID=1926288 RepID=UPI002DDDB067|nr:RNA methyltransferase [Noviherbaspirillum sp.]HEV2611263.1 RNA methyltransferase [Noviherbaspirillum sp.]
MKLISSRDNPLFKELKHLATSSQARRKAGRTLLDGVHLCETFLHHAGMPAYCVVSEESASHPEVADIVARCQAGRAQCIMLPNSLYATLSQVENGIGLLFVVATPHTVLPDRLSGSAVLLDNLQDPGNLGSILRSAAAAGIKRVFCSIGTCFAWSPKVLRAGMGAHFILEIYENCDLAQLLAAADVPVFATSSHAQQSVFDADLTRPCAWLFGHEGQGVSDELMNLATHRVMIPHLGAVESLNVAASAAVCIFEQLRQSSRSFNLR